MEIFNKEYKSWSGKWIWGHHKETEKNVFYRFRKEIVLDTVPEKLTLYITADTKFKLYINGAEAGYGSVMSQPFFTYYDIRDVTKYFKKGNNCVAVLVYHLGTMEDTKGGLLAELLDDGNKVLLATDDTWKAALDTSRRQDTYFFRMNIATPYQEYFDARKEPKGWKLAGFDDAKWENAKEYIGSRSGTSVIPTVEPWTRLLPRDIPFMTEYDVLPQSVVAVEENIGLDARTRSGDLSINLSAKGKKLEYSVVRDENNLLVNDSTSYFQTSTRHLDRIFDGYCNPTIILDFGRITNACIKLELEAAQGQIIDIGYAERLIDGEFNNAIESSFADRYVTRDGKQTYTSYTWKAFRYVKILFNRCFTGVTVSSIKAAVTAYPYKERGSFVSDEPLMNDVFDICQYTIKLCSNEYIVDTPFREQAQYLGDVAAVTLGCIYSCFGDTKLTGKFLKQSGMNQLPTGLLTSKTNAVSFNWKDVIPDYSLWWVMAVWNHFMYTGEEEFIHEFYPTVVKIINAFIPYLDEYGLISNMPYWVFLDWANIDKRGENAVLNAIYYGGLQSAFKMAQMKNDSYMMKKCAHIMTGIKRSFHPRFFNKKLSLYQDANISGKQSDMVSEQTNASAIYFGLCDKDTAKAIIEKLYIEKNIYYTEAQPFFTAFVLKALKKSGRMDIVLEIIKERWGGRMVAKGAKSTYEEWYLNGSWRGGEFDNNADSGEFKGIMRTASHAWSTYPAEFLIKDLAGIEIIEPGCKKIKVRPFKTTFDYKSCYPTPHGNVSVEWNQADITIEKPDEIEIIKD